MGLVLFCSKDLGCLAKHTIGVLCRYGLLHTLSNQIGIMQQQILILTCQWD